jgi:DNA-binding CsgD family transcriptional regulator
VTRPPVVAIGSGRTQGRATADRRSGALELRIQLTLEQVAAALRDPSVRGSGMETGAQLSALIAPALAALSERVRMPGARVSRTQLAELCGLLVELQEFREELREQRLARHMSALSCVQEGITRLRASDTLAELLDRACAEVCRSCGFDRALLFRVDGSELVPEGAYFGDDESSSREILALGRAQRPQLTHMLLETEMLRRRQPALVEDPQNDPRTYKPIVEATATRAYVAAPILPDDRVIGFLHADCHHSGRPLDTLDRDTLWAFARGFAYAVERVMLRERLKAQREHVRRMVSSTEAVMTELCEAEVELSPSGGASGEDMVMARSAASLFVAPESRIEALLTRREREVLALMASGATNAAIAERLVISHGTVKSHVKHILRKLRAANRAEAVSRYMRLSVPPPG